MTADLRDAAQALQDDVLDALDLPTDTFRTEGGFINRGKLRAAILHPDHYLPDGHWLVLAKAAPPTTAPAPEGVQAQRRLQWMLDWWYGCLEHKDDNAIGQCMCAEELLAYIDTQTEGRHG